MTGPEIFKKITENNAEILKLCEPGTFVLNAKVWELTKENEALQKICPHEFETECVKNTHGEETSLRRCKYCYWEEKE